MARADSRQKAKRRLPAFPTRQARRVELLGGGVLILFSIVIASAFLATGFQKIALRSPNIAAVVSAILVGLANGDRLAYGLDSLTVNPTLVAVAQAKANDMATYEYFAHVSPEGIEPWHWFDSQGYAYQYAGENLAVDFSDSADVERAWMGSPSHRDNILNARYTEIGIASAQGMYQGRPTTFVVQMFGTPSDTSSRALSSEVAPANTSSSGQSKSDVQVLGFSAPEELASSVAIVTTEPAIAAVLSENVSNGIPLWGYAVGFPRDTLRYAYYAIGLFVLLALAVETGLEIRWHHRRRAIRAGALILGMSALFVLADYAFFAEPVVAFVLRG